jgi:uncharacterized protein
MRIVMSFLVAPAVVYLALCAYMYVQQRSLMYFPTAETHHGGAQVMRFDHDGESLKVWALPRSGSSALIYFGGNAEDVGLNIDAFSAAFPDYSLYLVNYRGYGGSSGRPTEAALFSDALAVYDRIRGHHPDISVMGRSLGSGVAVYVASERPVERLVLVTAYDSLVNVARAHYWLLPVGLLMRDRYDAASLVSRVSAPVLAVIAENDEVIPRGRSEALVKAFPPNQVRVEVIPGVGHNTLDLTPDYLGSVRAFLVPERVPVTTP